LVENIYSKKINDFRKEVNHMTVKNSLALLITLLFFTGCTTVGLVNGSIFTDVQGPIVADHSAVKGTVVEGRATVTGILGFATGDCSIETAIANALARSPGATKLENMTIDYHAKSVLGIYAEFTTIVSGVAVK
jgi:hypothetical protein